MIFPKSLHGFLRFALSIVNKSIKYIKYIKYSQCPIHFKNGPVYFQSDIKDTEIYKKWTNDDKTY